ncbi:MAG TPA: tetratricopeptide repeat protein, partial [Acidobacteriaceae bacterium]|nr:tetratricopeptide repeat protein [Acidobacteriaceae bacterium]
MLSLRTLAGIAGTLLLFSSLTGQVRADRVQQIIAALRNQQYAQALALLQPAIAQSPRDARLRTMQGVAFEGQGQLQQALSAYRQALALAPDDTLALQNAAQIEYDRGNPAGIPLLEHLLRLRPDDITSHGMLAVLEYQQGNCAAAAPHFEKASSLFASKLPALHAWGVCLVRLRRFDQAVSVFQQSVALNGSDPRERQILASVQMMAHEPQQALSTLEPLLRERPEANSLELASAADEDLHETDKAVDALRQAILLAPHDVHLYVDFAALSATHQSFQVGIDAVNDGIHLEPRSAPLYFARGMLYVQIAQYDKAEQDFEEAYALDPSQSLSVAAQGLAAVQQNDLTRALAEVQHNLTRRPDDPILLYLQADILIQQGATPGSAEFQTALRSAKRAVLLRPGLGPAREVLAKLYLQQGQYLAAAEQCRKALEIDPADQTALYHLIQAVRKTDKRSEIPALLKQLAMLRQQASNKEREQYRYKLV